jgi:hypothetical protein
MIHSSLVRRGMRLLLAGMLVMVVVALAAAQDEGDMMEQQLPEPPPEMQQLAWFIGEWDVKSRYLTDAENDVWLEEDLHTVHTYELNGNLIFEHFYGPFGGEPFEAWSLRKYNVNTGKWEQRWVDTQAGGFANWVGSYADDMFMGYAARFVDEDGKITGDQAVREVFDNITPDSFSWRYEQTKDGGATWEVTWTLEYTRKKM